MEKPKLDWIGKVMFWGKFIGRAEHLERLTPGPEISWKVRRVELRFGIETIGSVRNIRTSSVYKPSLNSWSPFVYPLISGSRLIERARGSMARANKSGDRGHPCLVPLPNVRDLELHPGSLIRVRR